jgi:hypothetical protein
MERFPLCCDPFVYRIDVLYYRRSVGCRLRNSHHRIPSELKRRPCAVPGYISAPSLHSTCNEGACRNLFTSSVSHALDGDMATAYAANSLSPARYSLLDSGYQVRLAMQHRLRLGRSVRRNLLVPAQPCRVRRRTNFLSAFLNHLHYCRRDG